jgi:2-polyprenyl-6-methoxyphenol hydroxylase-like FAD-dependent oxidoreductase
MKAVVIGCGRVGASVAKQLAGDGWDVTCVDDDELALTRLGDWRGGFVVGHGMDLDVLDRAGVAQADAVPARSIGHAIVAEAARRQADLIVLGSSPRWRRQSRFFSPTVDYVLKNAPCEVLVVAFPDGVFEVA